MTKLLLFFGLIFAVFYFFYRKLKTFLGSMFQPPVNGAGDPYRSTGTRTPAGRIDKGDMVRCSACGVYFPSGTGVKKGGIEFCSTDCADK